MRRQRTRAAKQLLDGKLEVLRFGLVLTMDCHHDVSFAEDLTQSEIGEIAGVSQMQVSRLIRQAIAQLQDAARRQPDELDVDPARV